MAVDWRDMARTDEWAVEMVDPNDLSTSRGYLADGTVTDLSLTLAYDTETKATAKVTTLGDDGYVGGSMLRIWHEVDDWGYREPVFTGYVTGTGAKLGAGVPQMSYELGSALWAMRSDLWPAQFSVASGATAMQGVRSVLDQCSRPYVELAGVLDSRLSATRLWQAGSSRLATLLDLADVAGDYVGVDGMGLVTVGPSMSASSLDTPVWELDTDDPLSVVTSSEVAHDVKPDDAPGRVIVTHKDGSTVTVGVADAPATYPTSSARRGYVVAKAVEEKELPGGLAQARVLAAQYLAQGQALSDEWSLETTYAPYRGGDVVGLRLWGDYHVGYVREADFDLLGGSVKLTIGGLS